MHHSGPIAGHVIVGASPQLYLIIRNNGHAINFFRVCYKALRYTHIIFALRGLVLDKMEGLHHEFIKITWFGILGHFYG